MNEFVNFTYQKFIITKTVNLIFTFDIFKVLKTYKQILNILSPGVHAIRYLAVRQWYRSAVQYISLLAAYPPLTSNCHFLYHSGRTRANEPSRLW